MRLLPALGNLRRDAGYLALGGDAHMTRLWPLILLGCGSPSSTVSPVWTLADGTTLQIGSSGELAFNNGDQAFPATAMGEALELVHAPARGPHPWLSPGKPGPRC